MQDKDKSPFAELHHIGIIVRDVKKTAADLEAVGIGPFEVAPMANLSERELHGKPVQGSADVWFAQLGQTRLELVQPVAGESLQKETLEKRGEGVEHLGFFVDDLWGEVDKLVARGWQVIQSARGPQGGGFAFLRAGEEGMILELVQPWM